MKPVICIAGPTASGKSAFAMRLASRLDEPLIFDILSRDKALIFVGGTGLYFRALLQGMADIPAIPTDVLDDTSRRLERDGIAALRQEAERLDPIAAERVLGNDPQRLQRIVNVARGTGQALSIWQAETHPIVPSRFARFCVLSPPRERLYQRINTRYDAMLRGGGLEEAKSVFEKGFDESLPVMKAIGLRQLRRYFNNIETLDDAIESAKRESRRFAKRQMTWFRNQPPKGETLVSKTDREAFLNDFETVQL